MNAYSVTYEFQYDGKCKDKIIHRVLLNEPLHNVIEGDTFDELWNILHEFNCFRKVSPVILKKGRAIDFCDQFFGHIYEWKNNCKSWKFIIKSDEINISVRELMDHNVDKVIRYLKERNKSISIAMEKGN